MINDSFPEARGQSPAFVRSTSRFFYYSIRRREKGNPLCKEAAERRWAALTRRKIRKGDLLLVGILLAAALLLGGVLRLTQGEGSRAVLTAPEGELVLPLSRDDERRFIGRGGIEVVVEVKNGAVRFAASGCPDQICVHSGWLTRAGETAACVPAGIALRVEGGEPEADAVV